MPARFRLTFQASISACVALAIGAQVWQLARTDWEAVGIEARDTIMPPVTAVGTTAPHQAAEAPALPPAAPSAPAAPAMAPEPAAPAAALPKAPSAVREEVESEMARLLEELKARPRPAPAPAAPPTGAELARAAVAKRLDETAAKLEALGAELKARASASAAELAKPKTLLENMKPTEAAAILGSMDDTTAARIASSMEERKAAAVLAAMPSERAARITLTIRSLMPDPLRQPVAQR